MQTKHTSAIAGSVEQLDDLRREMALKFDLAFWQARVAFDRTMLAESEIDDVRGDNVLYEVEKTRTFQEKRLKMGWPTE